MKNVKSFSCVLDTSAIISYLANEPGSNRVESIKSESAIPFMALSELYYVIWRKKGKAEADLTYALVKSWGLPILYPTEQVILTAGRLKATYHLGIADSYIASFALIQNSKLVTQDMDYEVLVPDLKLFKIRS